MGALQNSRAVTFKDGELSHETKELIAAANGIVMRCGGCTTHHVHLAQKLGVSREALLEMIGVCIQLGGGPAMAYGGEALAAYDQFAAAAD
ncbi:MAG: AhpD family alkylhydroperoxidase [Alphaproteobacteria bacterium]|jgi:AhpD family alkylhydroperoxidase